MTVHILGVRHHSPACARLVRSRIQELRPKHVLVEGPSDFNARMEELRLGHRLPLALYSYRQRNEGSRGVWYPFCAHSPEWIALETAAETGAQSWFCDLPAWDDTFLHAEPQPNGYADAERIHQTQLTAKLEEACHVEGYDALWDHLFEGPQEEALLETTMATYFAGLRGDLKSDPGEEARESFMARFIAWAALDAGDAPVLVVCGGWHAPRLEALWPALQPEAHPPCAALPAERIGTTLVPFREDRLDSFQGYGAGLPMPGFYRLVWEHGPEKAPEHALERLAQAIRAKRQPCSTADLSACWTLAQALASLRGHPAPNRCDLLDALATGLVKDAQEVPPPWTTRSEVHPRTHPMLAIFLPVLRGDGVGKLAPGTPLPDLVGEVASLLQELDLTPGAGRELNLELVEPLDRRRSVVLHRLRLLAVPGFACTQGPRLAQQRMVRECWKLTDLPETMVCLIEASAQGADLASASASALADHLKDANLVALAEGLFDGALAGLGGLERWLEGPFTQALERASELGEVAAACMPLLALHQHGELLGVRHDHELAQRIRQVVDRALWLVQALRGSGLEADPRRAQGVRALAEALRAENGLMTDAELARRVMRQTVQAPDAPPDLRGAALGFLWHSTPEADLEAEAAALFQATRSASEAGDLLHGLFCVAREEAVHGETLLGALDTYLCGLDDFTFLTALPVLRGAFSFFPPRERKKVALIIARLHGLTPVQTTTLLTPDPSALWEALALEAAIDARMQRYGLT